MANIKALKPQIFAGRVIMQYAKIILKNFLQKLHGGIKFALKIWTSDSSDFVTILLNLIFLFNL